MHFKYELDHADGPARVLVALSPELPYKAAGEAVLSDDGDEDAWGTTWYDRVVQFCQDWCTKRRFSEFWLYDDQEESWDHYEYADWSTSEGPRPPEWRIND